MSANTLSLNLSIQVPEASDKYYEPRNTQCDRQNCDDVSQSYDVSDDYSELYCLQCGEQFCYCTLQPRSESIKKNKEARQRAIIERKEARQRAIIERKEARQRAIIERKEARQRAIIERKEARRQLQKTIQSYREAYSNRVKNTKENPMFWIKNPDAYGRLKTLLTLMHDRKTFVNITEEQAISLLPAYAIWLQNASRTAIKEEQTRCGTLYLKINLNRWDLMNKFLDDMEHAEQKLKK
jgi:hypothetical protein